MLSKCIIICDLIMCGVTTIYYSGWSAKLTFALRPPVLKFCFSERPSIGRLLDLDSEAIRYLSLGSAIPFATIQNSTELGEQRADSGPFIGFQLLTGKHVQICVQRVELVMFSWIIVSWI